MAVQVAFEVIRKSIDLIHKITPLYTTLGVNSISGLLHLHRQEE